MVVCLFIFDLLVISTCPITPQNESTSFQRSLILRPLVRREMTEATVRLVHTSLVFSAHSSHIFPGVCSRRLHAFDLRIPVHLSFSVWLSFFAFVYTSKSSSLSMNGPFFRSAQRPNCFGLHFLMLFTCASASCRPTGFPAASTETENIWRRNSAKTLISKSIDR